MNTTESQPTNDPQKQSLAALGIDFSSHIPTYSLDDFLPMLLNLLVPRKALTSVPAFTPKTFVDCIQVYTDGSAFFLYIFMDGEWRVFPAGDVVSQIIAGSGISVSPGGGTGPVTVTNLGVTQIIAGDNIDIDPDYGTGAVTIHSDAPDAALFQAGNATHVGTGSGDQVISHGLGVTPKLLKITALYGTTTPQLMQSIGTYDGTDMKVITSWTLVGSGGGASAGTSSIISISDHGGQTAVATVTWTSTNFTLNWTPAGSPGLTNDVNFLWELYG